MKESAPVDPGQIDKEIRRVCGILERVAKCYPEASEEYEAIEKAALSYAFSQQHGMLKDLYDSIEDKERFSKKLSPKQKEVMKRAGVDF